MKKQLLIIGIIVLLVAVGLSGCEQQKSNDDTSRFIGTWSVQIPDDINSTINFFSNGTFSWNRTRYTLRGTFEIKDEKITMNFGGDIWVLGYSFSDNDKKLVFTDLETGNPGWYLTRQ